MKPYTPAATRAMSPDLWFIAALIVLLLTGVIVALAPGLLEPQPRLVPASAPADAVIDVSYVSPDDECLFQAIALVESSGNPRAYNKAEESAGIVQIRPIMIRDVNQHGYNFALADRYDPAKSAEIFAAYQGIYATNRPRYMSRPEYMSRIWNGGPRGFRKDATRTYWSKVQHNMREIRRRVNVATASSRM